MAIPPPNVTALLARWSQGDEDALEQLLPLVYDELRAIAERQFRRERPGHTLQPTALVHEAFLRLAGEDHAQWQNRAQFFAVAARVMRRVLVDHARKTRARKRGGAETLLFLEPGAHAAPTPPVDVIALEDALADLERLDERQVRVVELRFFGGLSLQETAHALGISPATVKREWAAARAWLLLQLQRA